jgi:predicted Zn-dependent peptidase
MMFKGTHKNQQGVFDRTMESSGARDLNAFTGTDYTAYVASLRGTNPAKPKGPDGSPIAPWSADE